MKECITKTFSVECENLTPEQRKEAINASEQQMLAMLFVCNADQDCHGELMVDLKNEFSPKVDNCPTALNEACQKLVNYTPKHPRQDRRRQGNDGNNNRNNEGNDKRDAQANRDVAFAQTTGATNRTPGTATPGSAMTLTLIAGTDGRTHDIHCHGCNQQGHCRTNCPSAGNQNNNEGNGGSA